MSNKLKKPKVITLIGQTASGKTSAAIKLAQAIGGEVISADSRQVYKHLNIGTDKVSKEQMHGIPHHLIDIADPLTDTYTVSDFVRDAQQAIADIHSRGEVPIVAGGTMLYIDALFGNILVPEVPPNEALRTELEQKSPDALFTELQERDPRRAQQMVEEGQHANVRRLVRALEVVEALGQVPNIDDLRAVESSYDILWLGMHNDPKVQKEKINTRNAEMLENGLLEEVADLQKMGITPEHCKNFGFEYLYPALYLAGTPIIKDNPPTLEDVLLKMNSSTWRYAKKQRAWWAGRSEISWFMPSEYEPLLEKAVSFLSNKC
jgi:tRNA dimethylallyltransferase